MKIKQIKPRDLLRALLKAGFKIKSTDKKKILHKRLKKFFTISFVLSGLFPIILPFVLYGFLIFLILKKIKMIPLDIE